MLKLHLSCLQRLAVVKQTQQRVAFDLRVLKSAVVRGLATILLSNIKQREALLA